MMPSLRPFLPIPVLLASLPACQPEPEPGPQPWEDPCGPEPAAWAPGGTVDEEAFAWGVQITDALPDSALVSVRTTRSGPFVLRAARGCEGSWTEVAPVAGLEPLDGGVVHAELPGLDAYSLYDLALWDADGASRTPVARFRTPPAPEAPAHPIRFGATSCLGDPDSPWPSLSHLAAEKPDFMLLLGDTIYADGDETVEDYRQTWGTALSTQGLVDVSLATSIVHTWDDHEVDNNWSWDDAGIEERHAAARQVFEESLPWRPGPGGSGIWRRVGWGSAIDLFVLDCRAERLDGNYISVEQMDWLKAGLLASRARFKVILNSVPITDLSHVFGGAMQEDRWEGFPAQREEILAFIDEEQIPGLLWIAGDLHYGEIGHVGQAGDLGASQWEVLVGPSGSMRNPLPGMIAAGPNYGEYAEQFPVLLSEWSGSLFEADPETGTILVHFIGDDGTDITAMTLDL